MESKNSPHLIESEIVELNRLTTDVFELLVNAPEICNCPEPGNFVSILYDDFHILRKPFSIAGTKDGILRLLIKEVGRVTGKLSRAKPGEALSILGPLGNAFPVNSYRKILCISGGIGIAPFLYLFEKSLQGYRLGLLAGFNTGEDFWEEKCFENLDYFMPVAEDGSLVGTGTPLDFLKKSVSDFNPQALFMVGPKSMLKVALPEIKKLNLPCYASLEEYMGCSLGACNSCLVKTERGWKKVCEDGPVFDLKELINLESG